MKKLIIFAIFLSACCGITEIPDPCSVTYSDAQPIQFWPVDCDTFNEEEVDGVFSKCFCQPFECDDEIAVQFLVPIGDPVEVTIPVTLPALSAWLNRSSDPDLYDWTTGVSPSVNLPGNGISDIASSEYIYANYAFLEGYDYVITINYNYTVNTSISNPRTSIIYILDSGFNVLFSFSDLAGPGSGSESITISFTATAESSRLAFRHFNGSDVTIALTSVTGTRNDFIFPPADPYFLSIRDENEAQIGQVVFQASQVLPNKYRYDASFVPNNLGICNEKVQLFVVHNSTPDTDILKSDCIHIKETWKETILINYYNQRNFAGLIDPASSPNIDFNLRIPAVFSQERFPKESEVIDLSNSRSIQLFSQLKSQKLLETGPMPFYMHKKLNLVLQHQFVTLKNKSWVFDSYDLQESNKRQPLRRALAWLTEKDFVVRNVL
jgi:hypothetical protein